MVVLLVLLVDKVLIPLSLMMRLIARTFPQTMALSRSHGWVLVDGPGFNMSPLRVVKLQTLILRFQGARTVQQAPCALMLAHQVTKNHSGLLPKDLLVNQWVA